MGKLLYKLVQDNRTTSQKKGYWYARAAHTYTLSFREFIEHVISHGTTFDRGTVTGVMTQMLDCLKELMLDSKRVRLGDLGTFYLNVKSKGTENIGDFNPAEHILGVRMRFLPDRKEGNDSQSIRKKVQFKAAQELSSLNELQAREAEKAARKEAQGGDSGDSGNSGDSGDSGNTGNDEP